jgi:predicted RNase H-like HicB family nuclease
MDDLSNAVPPGYRYEPHRMHHNQLSYLHKSWYGGILFDMRHLLGGENLMLTVEVEQEPDGRFVAEVPELPGVMVYGRSREDAVAKVEALALRTIADRLEQGEPVPELPQIFSAA